MKLNFLSPFALASTLFVSPVGAEIKISVDRNLNESATPAFKFRTVPAPSKNDAAALATVSIANGTQDENGGGVGKLHDGKLPADEDQPAENFFFSAGSQGGRLLVDLGSAKEIKQVNTYAWHSSTRGPQVYVVYAS